MLLQMLLQRSVNINYLFCYQWITVLILIFLFSRHKDILITFIETCNWDRTIKCLYVKHITVAQFIYVFSIVLFKKKVNLEFCRVHRNK